MIQTLKLGMKVYLAGTGHFGYIDHRHHQRHWPQIVIEGVIKDMYDEGNEVIKTIDLKKCGKKRRRFLQVIVHYASKVEGPMGLDHSFGICRPSQLFNNARQAAEALAKQLLVIANEAQTNFNKINADHKLNHH
jgi:hypothetical protein